MPGDLPVYNLGLLGVNVVKTPHHLEDGALRVAQNAELKTSGGRKGIGKRKGIAVFSDDLGAAILAIANITLLPEVPTDPDTGDLQQLGDFGPGALLTMRAKGYLTAATTSVANNTETSVSFDAEDYDVGNLHDTLTNPSRFTIPAGGDGYYAIVAQAKWATDADGVRSTRIYKNGALQAQQDQAAGTTDFTTCQASTVLPLVATDYIEMKVFHTAGAALNLQGSDATETNLVIIRILGTAIAVLPRCLAVRTTNQSIANGAATAVQFDGEAFDTHTMHDNSTNNSRITVPTQQDGLYLVVGEYAWASTLVGPYQIILRKNGATTLATLRGSGLNDGTQDATGQITVLTTLVAGDYMELVVSQFAVGGGAHDIIGSSFATTLQMARIG